MFLRTNIPKQLNRNQIPTPMIGNIIPIPMCWNEIPTRVCRNEIPMGHGRNCPLSIILPPGDRTRPRSLKNDVIYTILTANMIANSKLYHR